MELPTQEFYSCPLAENENIAVPLLWVEKLHSMLVGSNPLPLTIPVPDMLRNVAF
jgi:hypothetical protein